MPELAGFSAWANRSYVSRTSDVWYAFSRCAVFIIVLSSIQQLGEFIYHLLVARPDGYGRGTRLGMLHGACDLQWPKRWTLLERPFQLT
jgi:hypothetical protein